MSSRPLSSFQNGAPRECRANLGQDMLSCGFASHRPPGQHAILPRLPPDCHLAFPDSHIQQFAPCSARGEGGKGIVYPVMGEVGIAVFGRRRTRSRVANSSRLALWPSGHLVARSASLGTPTETVCQCASVPLCQCASVRVHEHDASSHPEGATMN